MKISTLLTIATVIGGSLVACEQALVIPVQAKTVVKATITNVNPGNTKGVYSAVNAMGAVRDGEVIDRTIVIIPMVINCRDSTYAAYNHNIKALSIEPIRDLSPESTFCKKRYGWSGD